MITVQTDRPKRRGGHSRPPDPCQELWQKGANGRDMPQKVHIHLGSKVIQGMRQKITRHTHLGKVITQMSGPIHWKSQWKSHKARRKQENLYMSCGHNLVHGEGTLDKPSSGYRFGYRFRVGPYRFCNDGNLTTLSILWSYLILSWESFYVLIPIP